ncbi:hypothetical protein [Alloactinosynnema sp. L-07]|nr:hypothetical protein [Alloactinosynnema sp. L-07]
MITMSHNNTPTDTKIITTRRVHPQDYGIHVSRSAAYLRTAYGHPAAIAFHNGLRWAARPMREFHPERPGPHGRWTHPGTETTADTYEAAFTALGFPADLDPDRPQIV